jgi:hypothetical protein
MQKGIASSLAAMGMAAAIVFPSPYVAYGRSDRAETPALSISESVDRADARIADLKANLRLSANQAKHWPGLESVLHDIAMKRAKSLAGERDLQTGHASSESSAAAAPPIADEDGNVDARTERGARAVIRSWTTSRRCGARPTPLQRSLRTCGKSPTQPSRSMTPSMTGNAGGSCSSCIMICGRTKWTIHATGAADL